jgi:hypothetical protein
MEGSKFDTRGARVIAAQLYVAKGLKRNPAKMIKFMKINKEYFPNISEEMLLAMQKEHNLTDDDINKQDNVEFADLRAEKKFEKDLLEKAQKIDEERKKQNRDHRGDSKQESKKGTIYKDRQQIEIEEMFKKMIQEKSKAEELNLEP